MSIKCKCGQERNYFLKNLKFQKGKFNLSFDFSKKYNEQATKYQSQVNYILGNQIKTHKELQSILFRNSYVWGEDNSEFKDIYFKDLKFIAIDSQDSTYVKLKRLD